MIKDIVLPPKLWQWFFTTLSKFISTFILHFTRIEIWYVHKMIVKRAASTPQMESPSFQIRLKVEYVSANKTCLTAIFCAFLIFGFLVQLWNFLQKYECLGTEILDFNIQIEI